MGNDRFWCQAPESIPARKKTGVPLKPSGAPLHKPGDALSILISVRYLVWVIIKGGKPEEEKEEGVIPRYETPEMVKIWQEERKYQIWLEIEKAMLSAIHKLGWVSQKEVEGIRKMKSVDVSDLKALEEETQHEIVAFLKAISKKMKGDDRFLHYGMTSSDLMDTAMNVQIQESCRLIFRRLEDVQRVLKALARKYKRVLTVGRTHGVHAEPTSLGLKFARWYGEMERNRERLAQAGEETRTGKLSGAVGNFAHLPPVVEEQVCERLGLKPEPISTQVIPRDHYAHLLNVLALLGTSIEDIATEVRHLQKTEVLEMEEPFSEKQAGSSAMPHKKNPVVSERLCGLARVLRGNASAMLQNVVLWHERDISHSSADRILIPDSFILLDYMLTKLFAILQGLKVNRKRIQENLQQTHGLIYSQRILLELVKKGISRHQAYDLVQNISMAAWNSGKDFKTLVMSHPSFLQHFTKKELESFFTPDYYLRGVNAIYKRLGL